MSEPVHCAPCSTAPFRPHDLNHDPTKFSPGELACITASLVLCAIVGGLTGLTIGWVIWG